MPQAVFRRVESWHFSWSRVAVVFAVFSLGACQPNIGDECTTSADCSATGERLCDKTQRGGYCTVFNCEPDTCPEESVCISFGSELATAPKCQDGTGTSPYQRTFCMFSCESKDDCRDGYICADMKDPDNPWGAVFVENSGSGKVCTIAFTATALSSERTADVCVSTGPSSAGSSGSEPFGGIPSATGGVGGGGMGGTAGTGGEALGGAAGQAGSDGAGGIGGIAGIGGESGSAGAGGTSGAGGTTAGSAGTTSGAGGA